MLSHFSLVERQLRGSPHFRLIEDVDMKAVMHGNDVYTANRDLYLCPAKMTGMGLLFIFQKFMLILKIELVYALVVGANINVIAVETRSLAECIVRKAEFAASRYAIALKSNL